MLASLAIQPLAIPDKPKKPRKVRVDESKKRGTKRDEPPASNDENAEERPAKAAKVQEDDGNAPGPRRSTRNRGKETNYNEDKGNTTAAARALPKLVSASAQKAGMMDAARDRMKRVHDP